MSHRCLKRMCVLFVFDWSRMDVFSQDSLDSFLGLLMQAFLRALLSVPTDGSAL